MCIYADGLLAENQSWVDSSVSFHLNTKLELLIQFELSLKLTLAPPGLPKTSTGCVRRANAEPPSRLYLRTRSKSSA